MPDLKQLRLSSIDAIEIDEALEEAVTGEARIAPYLHLSLQHGDDLILKRMKRRHSRAEAIGLAQRLKANRPEMAFGADLIAGFPTETEAAFENSLSLIEEAGIAFLHAFPYSPRPGTPAERMPQVDGGVIKARAARLRAAGESALAKHLAGHVGTEAEALVERGSQARLPDFSPVTLNADAAELAGRPARVRLTGHDGTRLQGELI